MSTFVNNPTLATVHAVRVDIHDIDFFVQPDQYLISYVELTAPRTVTMPDSATVPMGKMYVIKDETGNAGTNNITIIGFGTPGSEQPVDGFVSGVTINAAKGALTLVCNGVSWYIV